LRHLGEVFGGKTDGKAFSVSGSLIPLCLGLLSAGFGGLQTVNVLSPEPFDALSVAYKSALHDKEIADGLTAN